MRSFVFVALALVAAGCGSTPPPTGMAAQISGTSWTLERVVLADGRVLRGDGDQVTFADDGALVISSCNQCVGTYALSGGLVMVEEPMGCTKRACPSDKVELERYLGGTLAVSRDGVYLVAEPMTAPDDDQEPVPTGVQVLLVPASTSG